MSILDKTRLQSTLQGKRVVVTRAREQADDLVRRLEELGAQPIVFPTIRIAPPADNYAALDAALRRVSGFDWVVFTSVNGVMHVWQRLAVLGMDASAFACVRVAAIGPATSEALAERGVRAEVVPELYVAEALLEAIPDPAGARFLLPRADKARDALRIGLEAAGARVEDVHAYRTMPAEPSPEALAALAGGVELLTFTSSSTVHHFVTQVGPERVRKLATQARVVVIGPITASTARELGLRVDAVATSYTINGLIEALIQASE